MKKYRKILCVIPVRKGSVRLQSKNFLKFGKKNLTELTIEVALKSRIFSKIIVSSDNKNLAKLCKNKKVDFFYRKNFCDNKSPVSLATFDTIRSMNLENHYKIVVQLMATCPLRIPEDIVNSVNFFLKHKKKFQISVFSCEWIKENYFIINHKNNFKLIKKYFNSKFYPTGSVWVARVKDFLKSKTFYGKNFEVFPLPWNRAIDIDTISDFNTALLLKKLNK